jgi:predicted peptidase
MALSCTSSEKQDSSADSDSLAYSDSDNLAESDTTLLITQGIPGENIPCYWIYLPENYKKSKALPVMIFLHGGGVGKDPDIDKLRDNGPMGYLLYDSELSSEVKDQIKKFIIVNPVLPEDPDNFTLWADNIDALDAIIDTVISCHKGDPTRLYVTGNSRGGQGAWRFPKYSRHHVAAIVPVCGHYIDTANLEPLTEIPVWTLCNTGDRVYGVQMRAVSIIEESGGDPFLLIDNAVPGDPSFLEKKHIATSFEKDGHNAWTATYRSPYIYKWMLSKKTH